jgi:hypothetical protein
VGFWNPLWLSGWVNLAELRRSTRTQVGITGSWSVVLGGAGIRGGQVYGATEADGVAIADKPLKVSGLMATIVRALGLDPETANPSNIGRPIPLADHGAEVAQELLI